MSAHCRPQRVVCNRASTLEEIFSMRTASHRLRVAAPALPPLMPRPRCSPRAAAAAAADAAAVASLLLAPPLPQLPFHPPLPKLSLPPPSPPTPPITTATDYHRRRRRRRRCNRNRRWSLRLTKASRYAYWMSEETHFWAGFCILFTMERSPATMLSTIAVIFRESLTYARINIYLRRIADIC